MQIRKACKFTKNAATLPRILLNIHDHKVFHYKFLLKSLDNGRAIVGKTVPCAISFRVNLMKYFGSLDHKKKNMNFEK
jgi:hypothetical protein